MAFAARLTDFHVCPMQTPAVVPIPHVGGPVIVPAAPNVLIGGLPAAGAGSMCTCVGPPDTILPSCTGARARVMVGGRPIAAVGDMTAHGGSIVVGCFTVLIGTGGMSAPPVPDTAALSEFSDMAADAAATTQAIADEAANLEQQIEDGVLSGDALADAMERLDEIDEIADGAEEAADAGDEYD